MKHFLSIVSVGVICVIFLAGGRRLAEDPHNRLVGFTPRPDEEESIESCLRGHLSEPGNEVICRKLMNTVREMNDANSRRHHARDSESLIYKYHYDFNAMLLDLSGVHYSEEDNPNTQEKVMTNLASCASYSTWVRQEWQNFYERRLNDGIVRLVTLMPDEQELIGDAVDVMFNHKNVREYIGHDVIAVDLALQRAAPLEIGEYYGKYNVVVEQTLEGAQNLVLYRNEQASCPTMQGNMMVTSLSNEDHLSGWFFDGSEPLKLRVRVHPIRQLFANTSDPDRRADVLRKALSLSFVLKPTSRSNLKDELPGHMKIALARSRRSIESLWTNRARCRLVDYRIDFRTPWQRGHVVFPPYFNVRECYGTCEFPLKGNITMHALLINKEMFFNPSPAKLSTISCVPNAYKYLPYAHRDQRGFLMIGVLLNAIATSCSCR